MKSCNLCINFNSIGVTKKIEKSFREQQHVGICNSVYNFATLSIQMSKTWYFIENSRKQTERKLSCNSKRSKEKQKTKTTGLPPVKRFLYSHIARLYLLDNQEG